MLSTGTGVITDLVDTGICLSTLVICGTSSQDRCQCLTAGVLCAHISIRAGTDHGPHRQRVNDRAACRGSAGVQGFTQQLAFVVQTSVLGGTILVFHTLWRLDRYTGHKWIAGKAKRASALRLVVGHQAVSIGSTGVFIEAGVNTVLVPTGLILRALCISTAADNFTGSEWIALVARDALAVGLVSGRVALGKPATGVLHQAGVHTLTANTGLSIPAVVVRLAANGLTRDERVSNIARRTGAHWTMVLDKALGTGATVAGVHALSVDAGLAVGAVVVSCTARRIRQVHRDTTGVRVRYPALSTRADHGSKWQTVDNSTYGSDMAGGQ